MASTLKSVPSYFRYRNDMSHVVPSIPLYDEATNTLMFEEDHGISYPSVDQNGLELNFLLPETLSASTTISSSFTEPFQMDAMEQQPTVPDYHDLYICSQAQSFDASYRQEGGSGGGTMTSFAPIYPANSEDYNWIILSGFAKCAILAQNFELGTQSDSATPTTVESIKVGRYSAEERRDRILRYLKKRNQRNFNKTIKYACRKTLADRRTRVRGRFAKNHEELDMKKVNDSTSHDHKDKLPCPFDFTDQMKPDGDDWLQEAIASLLYMPHIPAAGWHGEGFLK
ncbi:hypothetical protein Ancab_023332 [Ancistrocladus abbreviatus]